MSKIIIIIKLINSSIQWRINSCTAYFILNRVQYSSHISKRNKIGVKITSSHSSKWIERIFPNFSKLVKRIFHNFFKLVKSGFPNFSKRIKRIFHNLSKKVKKNFPNLFKKVKKKSPNLSKKAKRVFI